MKSLKDFSDSPKINRLREIILDYSSVVIGFSGGVDSTFLVKASLDFLGRDNVLAVTAAGAIHPKSEIEDARELADRLDLEWKLISPPYLEEGDFVANPPDRCYHCKKILFARLRTMAEDLGYEVVADGTIEDDSSDYRPGERAGEELGIKHPLREAGLTKKDIRKFGKEAGLPVWNKPSNACLATRVPYGLEVTESRLNKINRAESSLRDLGFTGFRVRHHGEVARIELRQEDLPRAIEIREELADRIETVGYSYVTLDLRGYRTGSLNELVGNEESEGS